MSDEIDIATEQEEWFRDSMLRRARTAAARMPAGEPGDCYECGKHFNRVVLGLCAKCREEVGL